MGGCNDLNVGMMGGSHFAMTMEYWAKATSRRATRKGMEK